MRLENAKLPAADFSTTHHREQFSANAYRGRFAPSPTGPLHFGSLVAAVASYLDARAHQGTWLVRMEDLDPPREVPGATDTILKQLEAHGLHSGEPVLFQSQRTEAYLAAIDSLSQQGLIYPCDCSRSRIRELGGIYDGHCRHRQAPPVDGYAWRIQVPQAAHICFDDIFQGSQASDLSREAGDFVIRRRDGLFAYQLAVTLDDAWQGITHVIRGSDLLDSTPRQIFLFEQLGYSIPAYGHLPVALNAVGDKLSKQNLAEALDSGQAAENLLQAMAWLGLVMDDAVGATPEELLLRATQRWRREVVPTQNRQAPAGF